MTVLLQENIVNYNRRDKNVLGGESAETAVISRTLICMNA
jgi:hypothetical protein